MTGVLPLPESFWHDQPVLAWLFIGEKVVFKMLLLGFEITAHA